jgi:hypothetical protein
MQRASTARVRDQHLPVVDTVPTPLHTRLGRTDPCTRSRTPDTPGVRDRPAACNTRTLSIVRLGQTGDHRSASAVAHPRQIRDNLGVQPACADLKRRLGLDVSPSNSPSRTHRSTRAWTDMAFDESSMRKPNSGRTGRTPM